MDAEYSFLVRSWIAQEMALLTGEDGPYRGETVIWDLFMDLRSDPSMYLLVSMDAHPQATLSDSITETVGLAWRSPQTKVKSRVGEAMKICMHKIECLRSGEPVCCAYRKESPIRVTPPDLRPTP